MRYSKIFILIAIFIFYISLQCYLQWQKPNKVSTSLSKGTTWHSKQDVETLILIQTSPRDIAQRDLIRNTWLKECLQFKSVVVRCLFITEHPDVVLHLKTKNDLKNENMMYPNDFVFLNHTAKTFGHRILRQLEWATANFNFKYLTRVDDDVMLCMKQFILNTAILPNKPFLWGWLHCVRPGMVYIDGRVIMLSASLVQVFLSQSKKDILCHPYRHQTLASWINATDLDGRETVLADNARIYLHSPDNITLHTNLMEKSNLCENYLAVQGRYGEDIKHLWERKGDLQFEKEKKEKHDLIENNTKQYCSLNVTYDWKQFKQPFVAEPFTCYKNNWFTDK